ncbi:porin [Dechloromonas denitrificans]|uniref:porin n=1 Tax=Dechloromonas denitrificans TaxID=281362 RepID=UPI001CF92363|nr:porin [Dechloromonas denitrificans]UCV04369.1 porin [Dechloromonas denitrificans]UCV08698.1 porin [Dechloromonas denitrificans]
MQKKIIALAIAGLASTAAFAQSNVTIYGIADAGVFYVHNSKGTDGMAVQSGVLAGSRLGFKGTEDLGNGVKAVFVLEQGFNIDNGSQASVDNGAFQRQAFVGLDSKAGTLTLGRQYAPAYGAGIRNDAFGGSVVSALVTLQSATGTSAVVGSNARWNNSIKYVSPTIAGFQGEAIYRAGEGGNDMASNEGYGIGLRYAAGPVNVDYVFQHADTSLTGTGALWANVAGGIEEVHFVGASFDAKVVKIVATAQLSDFGGKQLQQAAQTELYSLGAVVPVGKGNIHANVAYLDQNGKNRTSAGGSATSYALGYTHPLSKRTTLYTAVNYTDLSYGAKYAALAGGTTANSALGTHNAANAVGGFGDGTTFGVGINHAF